MANPKRNQTKQTYMQHKDSILPIKKYWILKNHKAQDKETRFFSNHSVQCVSLKYYNLNFKSFVCFYLFFVK